MKKRITTLLLSALLLTNITACNYVPEDEVDEPTGSVTDIPSAEMNDTPNKTENTPPETDSNVKEQGIITCNGVYYNDKISYTINRNNELILHIKSWDESFLVPNEDMFFTSETLRASCVVLSDDRGALLFNDFSDSSKPIKIIRFTKGISQITIDNLTFQSDENYAYKYCNFIDEQTGYLFFFDYVDYSNDVGLYKLLKTTDGGQTWITQAVENKPSTHRKEKIIYAKMLTENVGLIAGAYFAADDSDRTFITEDGGLTWSEMMVPNPKNSADLRLWGGEVCDILYEDGIYIMVCRFGRNNENNSYDCDVDFQYSSTDLKTWTPIE